ncbi:similar to Saccharomyces cerevisiae YBR162W-A YSY6 Protein whose expression suppresses a secretory pathway mutation in E. coli [Maudiozyma saulgeensis]|uniref:Stress-associated endoplasmic reticulum protein n=1 Tax=Maudiozyma saulgeensis TaxID=1789683 RepID=A0A1X7R5N1_9SACH|nr:similar to Saccharomyces cerevisiae YBR162W-A YSY6 Protein whose expression suppresses a secretory pathway mutation in E. coli [Kazachstania saulgeensis]
MAIQTPKQRLANEKFNKNIEKHRKFGKAKPAKIDASSKPTISKYWMYALLFLLVGGGVLELFSNFI